MLSLLRLPAYPETVELCSVGSDKFHLCVLRGALFDSGEKPPCLLNPFFDVVQSFSPFTAGGAGTLGLFEILLGVLDGREGRIKGNRHLPAGGSDCYLTGPFVN